MAQKEQNKEDGQDQPHQAAAPDEDVVAAAVAVAAAQQGENQDHVKDHYDKINKSPLSMVCTF